MKFQPLQQQVLEVYTPSEAPLEVARMVAYNSLGKILLVQGTNGRWGLAGGKTDGELLSIAGPRELFEEANAKAEPITDFVLYTHYVMTNRNGYNVGQGYAGREYRGYVAEGIITNENEVRPGDETIAVAFATIEELHRYSVGADTWLALGALGIHQTYAYR